jgi:hypothetical protein
MKLKLTLTALAFAVVILGGCATTEGGKSGASAKSTKAVTVKDVVARYAQAIYGKDGLKKHPQITTKGSLSIEQFNLEGPFTRYTMAPDSTVSVAEIMGMSLNTGCHKGVCWSQQPGAGTSVLTGDAAALQLQQSDIAQWEHPERYYTSMEIVQPAPGQESPNTKIKAVKKNGDTDYYDFAKDSGLLVAAVIEGETAQGRLKIAMQFRNYKDFDGMMFPMELIQTVPQGTIKLTFTEVSFAPITEDKFAKPN